MVGISGPDGSGKSGLVAELLRRFSATDPPVARIYVFGCVMCRNLPARFAPRAMTRRGLDRPKPDTDRVRTSSPGHLIVNTLRTLHGLVDAGELAVRLWAARRRAESLRSRGPGPLGSEARVAPIVLTDRSPLDGLVKFAPSPGSAIDRAYRRLGKSYGLVILLEAPADVLAQRDLDHGPEVLADMATRFERFRSRLDRVVRLETANRTLAEVADRAEGAIRSAGMARS